MINYENLINERVSRVKPSGIRKFFDIAATMDDVLSLSIGEPDFITPWNVRGAGIDSLVNGHTYYTSNAGMIELRRKLIASSTRLDTRRDVGVLLLDVKFGHNL